MTPHPPLARLYVCTANLVLIEHRVTVRFNTPGSNTVRIIGANRGFETNDKTVEWVVERFVIAR
jgi:hypothetical protein